MSGKCNGGCPLPPSLIFCFRTKVVPPHTTPMSAFDIREGNLACQRDAEVEGHLPSNVFVESQTATRMLPKPSGL